MQGIPVGIAINAQDHGLTIDDEMPLPVLQRGIDDPQIPIGPDGTVVDLMGMT
jgi:hypothetical protein